MDVIVIRHNQAVHVRTPQNIVEVQEPLYKVHVHTGILPGGIPYEGDYTITPTPYEQTLNTYGKTMRDNVTIEPIPHNYGLITWDGSVLTVS